MEQFSSTIPCYISISKANPRNPLALGLYWLQLAIADDVPHERICFKMHLISDETIRLKNVMDDINGHQRAFWWFTEIYLPIFQANEELVLLAEKLAYMLIPTFL